MNRNQKNAILVTLLTLLMVAASCIAGYAGYNIFNETQEYRQSDEAYDFVLGEASSDETEYTIDFDTLAKINPDITGWRKRSKIRVGETKTRPDISVIGVKTRPDIFDNGFKHGRKYPKMKVKYNRES